jgi:hypothetical protein
MLGKMWKGSRAGRPEPAGLRFAELFGRALDRLGDPRAPLRVGALRTLELLAQDHPEHRQAIVDVFCAYLRMPAGDDGPVRQAAVAILARHLRRTDPSFWAGVDLDLTGATLTDFDLTGCQVDGDLRLDHASLLGPAKLRGVTVGGSLGLRGARLHEHAWLERATFGGACHFEGTTFQADAWFGGTMFAGRAVFAGTEFGGHAWFGGCTFRSPVQFDHAVFRRSAGFRGVVAHAAVSLTGTTFLGTARVSRRGAGWSVLAPGWRVVVDQDNESVGQLLWAGAADVADLPDVTPVR